MLIFHTNFFDKLRKHQPVRNESVGVVFFNDKNTCLFKLFAVHLNKIIK